MRGVGESVGSAVFGTLGRVMARTQEKRGLPVDLLESDDAFLAIFDAPGAHSSDIQVRFEDDTIFVRLDRFRSPREEYEMTYPGRGLALDGRTTLPDGAAVDPAGATATLKEDGTLHVRIPKADQATAHDGSDIETEPSADEQ
ncbi:Hsp20 family protein [Halovenus sp. WSH3]|uniref:Hsp20 family protein n=1 Tax=Halovenus carboxidivorans TaxID=2692199 RepID=A0A6B0TBH6_9EURY|nr:Hsp20/alpha crystallin family protein [Halovenus carboxidivorans]MXR52581.1 Hsp20 family protein [Halovenus carboxidivorans]